MFFAVATLSQAVMAQHVPDVPRTVRITPDTRGVAASRPARPRIPLPAGHLDPATAFLGLDPCDYSRSYFDGALEGAVEDVGNPAVSCAVWSLDQTSDIIAFSGWVRTAGATLPVAVYVDARDLKDRAFRNIVVDVTGGPGGDISPGINDSLQIALAERGSVVVKLGYTGTRHGTLFPKPNLEAAMAQIAEYTRSFRAAHPAMKLLLLGESLGGNIVTHVAGAMPSGTIDGIVLAIPLVFSPDAALANFRRLKAMHGKPFADLTVRLITAPDASWTEGQEARISTEELLSSFFPAHARQQSLPDLLSRVAGIRVLLAYGDADERVGNHQLGDLDGSGSRLRKIRLSLNHDMNTYWAQIIADSVEDLLR